MSSKLVLVALVALMCGAQLASALPTLWLARPGTCGKHPTRGFGPHRAPVRDSNIKFTISPASGGAAIKAPGPLRPGTRYLVKVVWSKTQVNHALLTTSLGSLLTRTGAPSSCRLSAASRNPVTSYSNTLILPTSAKGKVTLMLTHSAPGLPYYQANVTYNVVAKTTGRKLA